MWSFPKRYSKHVNLHLFGCLYVLGPKLPLFPYMIGGKNSSTQFRRVYIPTIRIPVVEGGARPFPIFRDRAVRSWRGVTVERNAVEGGVIGPTVVTHHWPKFAEFSFIFGHLQGALSSPFVTIGSGVVFFGSLCFSRWTSFWGGWTSTGRTVTAVRCVGWAMKERAPA